LIDSNDLARQARKGFGAYAYVLAVSLDPVFRAPASQLLSPHIQELPILRRTPPPPRFTPNPHRHRRSHTQHDHDTIESEDWPKASGIDEVLQRLRDGEVDARGADGEDDDDFSRDLFQIISGAIV
jgi:hypothetical protein